MTTKIYDRFFEKSFNSFFDRRKKASKRANRELVNNYCKTHDIRGLTVAQIMTLAGCDQWGL